MSSALRKAAPSPVTRPLSIAGLAERLGVPRQRVYNLVRRGHVRAEPLSGTLVIQPEEASRVIDAAIRIDTRKGSRLIFDFI
jgi:hypothetical protein